LLINYWWGYHLSLLYFSRFNQNFTCLGIQEALGSIPITTIKKTTSQQFQTLKHRSTGLWWESIILYWHQCKKIWKCRARCGGAQLYSIQLSRVWSRRIILHRETPSQKAQFIIFFSIHLYFKTPQNINETYFKMSQMISLIVQLLMIIIIVCLENEINSTFLSFFLPSFLSLSLSLSLFLRQGLTVWPGWPWTQYPPALLSQW
jgi:hypothetical protein